MIHAERRAPILLALLIAGAAGASAQTAAPIQPPPIPAGGLTTSLPLTEVLARARANASLQLQIRLQLHRAELRREDVICRATVFDPKWSQLSGQSVGPYTCPIGRRTLFLTGTFVFADARGQKLAATDADLQSRAAKVSETRFKWHWTSNEARNK